MKRRAYDDGFSPPRHYVKVQSLFSVRYLQLFVVTLDLFQLSSPLIVNFAKKILYVCQVN